MQETKSNEKEIREATREWLKNNYSGTVVRDEFTQHHLVVRNDLFAVSDKHLISVEIKSCSDTLSRLEKQVLGYKEFSNAVIVVIDKKHLKSYQSKFQDAQLFYGVGLLVWEDGELKLLSRPSIYKIPMLYNMMWSTELLLFFSGLKLRSKISKSSKDSQFYIDRLFTYNEIYEISKYIFINRIKTDGTISPLPDELKRIIDNKQEQFIKLIKGI